MTDDPFDLLGVPRAFALGPDDLARRHRDLSRALHPDRYVSAPAGERRLALARAVAVNEAFRTLRDPLSRATALLALHGTPLAEGDRASPAVLLDVMELREALDEVRAQPPRVAALRATVSQRMAAEESVLAGVFTGHGSPDGAALNRARDAAIKLRYFTRFMEEADALEG